MEVHTSVRFFEDWPGGLLLNAPGEPNKWEIDTADSNYELDQDNDNNADDSDSINRDSSETEPTGIKLASENQQDNEVLEN